MPDLAESWKVSPDGLTYDFKLQSGLYWHDDMPVTAADVLYTVSAMQDADFPGDPSLHVLWQAVDVSAPDGPNGLTVRFKLKNQQPSRLSSTTRPWGCYRPISGSVCLSKTWRSQSSTRARSAPGLSRRATSVRRISISSPTRAIHGPTPYLTGLTVRFYPDQQSLLPAYERGEIDGISYIAPEDMDWAASRRISRCSPRPCLATHWST